MLRRIICLCLPVLLTACASRSHAPVPREPALETAVRGHMQFLASDALNGRGSGTRDEWIAASYVAAHFRSLGLQPLTPGADYVHEVRIERSDVNQPPTLNAAGREFTHFKDMLVTSFAASQLSGPLVKITAGTTANAGAVVLMPTSNPPSAGQVSAAAMVLSLESDAQRKRRLAGPSAPGPPLRLQWVVGTPRRVNIALDQATYDAIASLPDSTPIGFAADVKPAETTRTWNAVAQLTGRRPDEIIVLSAHHDHVGNRTPAKAGDGADTIYNGADDDASGTIAVMELATALARQRVERTLVFATFGSEETGGQGSSHFIDASGLELRNVVANLQFEMIGRPDPKVPAQTLWLTGYERSNLGDELARRGARLVADPHPEQSFFTRSDNIRFARRGIVAHTVSSYGLHTDYHQPSDEIGDIDFAHMSRSIQSMIDPIRWLANSAFTPAWRPGMQP